MEDLVVMLCIGCESEVSCFDDDSRVGRLFEESEMRCVILHYFWTEGQYYFRTVEVSDDISV